MISNTGLSVVQMCTWTEACMTAKTRSVVTICGFKFLYRVLGFSLFLENVPCSIIPKYVCTCMHTIELHMTLPVLVMCGLLRVEGDMSVFPGGVLPVN